MAQVCEFIELEEACLQKELMANPLGLYTEASAAAGRKLFVKPAAPFHSI